MPASPPPFPSAASHPDPAADVHAVVAAHARSRLADQIAMLGAGLERVWTANSRWMTEPLAWQLLEHRNEFARRALAGNAHCPRVVLDHLAAEGDPLTQRRALRNPSTSYALVAAAEEDEAAVKHPDCPSAVLLEAAGDVFLRAPAVAHPNFPANRVHALAADLDDLDVSSGPALLRSPHLTQREAVAILERINPLVNGERLWAENPNADPAWLADIAQRRFTSDSPLIRVVGKHPSTPAATLARIASRHDERLSALGNPACPASALHLAVDTDAPLGNVGGSPVQAGRHMQHSVVATNPAATASVLARIRLRALYLDELKYDFALAHARSGSHAHTILALVDDWRGTLADLLEVSTAVTT